MEPADHDELPSGTVTFLLTDIEDSSGQWEASPGDMRRALSVHDEIVGQVVKDPPLGRTSEDQITIADLTGVAIQDIQIAKMVDRALR